MPPEVQADLNKLEDAVKTARVAGDKRAEARAFNQIGELYYRTSNYPQALESYNQALTRSRSAKDAPQQAAALNGMGSNYRQQGQNQKALAIYQQALDLASASGDERGQAGALDGIGWVDNNSGQNQRALEFQNRALQLARKTGDSDLESVILRHIGVVSAYLGKQQEALEYLNQALLIHRQKGDRDGEALTITYLGIVYMALGEREKALDFCSQALTVLRGIGDRDGEAYALVGVGLVYEHIGQEHKALDYFSQALPIFDQIGDRGAGATTLNNVGLVYFNLGDKRKALEFYNRALLIHRQVGHRDGEADTLANLGTSYSALGEEQKALEYYIQALSIIREVGDSGDEATMLSNIGKIYDDLGDNQNALQFYMQALPIHRRVGDREGEATTLSNVGAAYSALGKKQRALDYYDQALPLLREVGDRGDEAIVLNNIGRVYDDLGEQRKALDYYNQALPINRQVGDRDGEATVLTNLGAVYYALGEQQKAFEYYRQALSLAFTVNEPLLEATILSNLMVLQTTTQPTLGIFYGKQAVNLLQQIRDNIRELDKGLQRSFLASKEDSYHDLADLLIGQGRLPEAEQVLDLLKQQEYSDYVRGNPTKVLSPLTLTPAEKQAEEDYQKSTAQIVSLGEQFAQLQKIAARTPEQDKQYQQLSDQIDAASKGLSAYYDRLYVLFGKNGDANKQKSVAVADVSLLQDQIAEMPHTVALYTLVGKDRTRIIVITGATAVAREYAIPEKELNKKIADFQQVLRDPARDPKPLAQELYKILISPVKADLDQAKAETLVWSLDGVLRYVPMAALYDGKQYLVENYNTVTFTPASKAHLSEKPDVINMSAAAMGISRKIEDGLTALPAVEGELNDVVKDSQVQGANGALPGTILLNAKFTEKAMESEFGSQHTVVHIASHFVFKPGDDTQSYLLLAGKDEGGAGFHLTVADFSSASKLTLRHTDLLTLSACETGMSGSASNGREVDGLGMTAQLKGAKAVLSSLWAVNDASTGGLMGDFYRRWATGGGKVQKVEALRLAQLDLLQGRVKPQGDFANPDAPASFTHPYYWAPFVLMGNWR
jgi:CHAT domain-containing protein/Tfp pilus assembly protein PilF